MLRTWVACVCAALSLVGCAGGGVSALSNVPGDASPSPDYRIGPGDSLQIFVFDHSELSTTVQVRPDGRISTPLVEDLQASGRTPTELAREIEVVLSEYVRTPVVTVIVQGFVGDATQQVRVVGQAAQPRALQFRQGMTVLDVVIAVGGLSPSAAGNRALIVRRSGAAGTIEIPVKLDDLLNDGRIEENVAMMPGDVLVIPQSIF